MSANSEYVWGIVLRIKAQSVAWVVGLLDMVKRLVILLLGLFLLLLTPSPAGADLAPPWTAQGAAVAPGQSSTQVQMAHEEVILDVEALQPDSEEAWRGTDNLMVAHVEANFVMRNVGQETEAFDVWFPLTTGDQYDRDAPYPSQVEGFSAWVNGEPAAVEEAPGRDLLGFRANVPWAKWPVTFPAGQDVRVRVTYDSYPIGWEPWGTFYYILETGGGWHGPIGEGTITFHLPYHVTSMNVQLGEIRQAYTGPDRPFDISVDGADVIWHFTDLEPRRSERLGRPILSASNDNPALPMLVPSAWAKIQAAQANANQHSRSAEAHLRLAEALKAATDRRRFIYANEANAALIKRADAAYQRAFELAPQDVDVVISYLEWLAIPREQKGGETTLSERAEPVLSHALELAPDDQRVVAAQSSIEEQRESEATNTPTRPEPSSTPTPNPSPTPTTGLPPTPTRPPRPGPSPTPVPPPTRTPSPSPTATPTSTPYPMPTQTPSPTSTPTPAPTSTATPGSPEPSPVCPGSSALALVVVVIFFSRGLARTAALNGG